MNKHKILYLTLASALAGCRTASFDESTAASTESGDTTSNDKTTSKEPTTTQHPNESSSEYTITSNSPNHTSTEANQETTYYDTEIYNESSSEDSSDNPCGNGILEEGEGCDPGTKKHNPICSKDCQKAGRLVFISSRSFTGRLEGYYTEPNDKYPEESGIGDAAFLCIQMAKDALNNADPTTLHWRIDDNPNPYTEVQTQDPLKKWQLQTQFMPWLSNDYFQPFSDFKKDCTELPYRLIDGTVIAEDFASLAQTNPMIHLTETDMDVGPQNTWTNTNSKGERAGLAAHCGGWTNDSKDNSGNAFYGKHDEKSPSSWTIHNTDKCSKAMRIYCFEQCPD